MYLCMVVWLYGCMYVCPYLFPTIVLPFLPILITHSLIYTYVGHHVIFLAHILSVSSLTPQPYPLDRLLYVIDDGTNSTVAIKPSYKPRKLVIKVTRISFVVDSYEL